MVIYRRAIPRKRVLAFKKLRSRSQCFLNRSRLAVSTRLRSLLRDPTLVISLGPPKGMSTPDASNFRLRASRSVLARRRTRVVAIVESLPEALVTVAAHRHLSLEVRGKRFGYYLDDHHGDGRVALNCKAEPGANAELAGCASDRFHLPAYLGSRGWIGLWIDLPIIDWDEVQSIIVDAYRLTAPKTLLKQLESHRLAR